MTAVEKLVCIEKERVAPKTVDMTEPSHLDRFKRAFEEAVSHMGVPLIRTTLEIFSKDWDEFVASGEISKQEAAGVEELVYGKKAVAAANQPKKSSLEALSLGQPEAKQQVKVLSDFALRHLGITPAEEKKHNPLKRFWELRRGQVEPLSDWRSRVVLWDWIKA